MKTNYDKILEETINELKGRKPSLLLHSCCNNKIKRLF